MSFKNCSALLGLSAALAFNTVQAEETTDNLTLNGFLTQGFFYTDHNNVYGQSSDSGSFEFREAAVNASYRFSNRVRGAAQVMSRTAGDVDNGEPKLDYALLDYRFTNSVENAVGIRFGRLKIPFGFYNETRDVAFTRPSIMLPQSLYFDQARDLELSIDGAIFYSYVDVPGGWLDFDFLYGSPQHDTNVEYAYLAQDATGRFDDSEGYMGRIIYNLDGGRIRLGLTTAEYTLSYKPGNGPGFPVDLKEFSEGDMKLDVLALSAQYNAENWTLTSEYMQHALDWNELGGVFTFRPESTIESWYLQLQYRLNSNWELLLRYDDLVLDKDDPQGVENAQIFVTKLPHNFYSQDVTLGVGWQPDPDWSFRAEWHNVKGTGWAAEQDNPDPAALRKYWNILALQATYRF